MYLQIEADIGRETLDVGVGNPEEDRIVAAELEPGSHLPFVICFAYQLEIHFRKITSQEFI